MPAMEPSTSSARPCAADVSWRCALDRPRSSSGSTDLLDPPAGDPPEDTPDDPLVVRALQRLLDKRDAEQQTETETETETDDERQGEAGALRRRRTMKVSALLGGRVITSGIRKLMILSCGC